MSTCQRIHFDDLYSGGGGELSGGIDDKEQELSGGIDDKEQELSGGRGSRGPVRVKVCYMCGNVVVFLLENKYDALLLLLLLFYILHLSLSFYVFVSVFTKIFFYFQFLLSYFLLFMSDCKAFTYLLFTIFFEV